MLKDSRALTSSVSLLINCTIHQTCFPGIFQELIYWLQKAPQDEVSRTCGPNGLLVHLNGPYCEPQNNLSILFESSFLAILEQCAIAVYNPAGIR